MSTQSTVTAVVMRRGTPYPVNPSHGTRVAIASIETGTAAPEPAGGTAPPRATLMFLGAPAGPGTQAPDGTFYQAIPVGVGDVVPWAGDQVEVVAIEPERVELLVTRSPR